jgi:phosphoribosylformylglycinamidine (FGAM) synthase-like amidotransferase family enzyme
MVKVYVTTGLGIGCHDEVYKAYELAGAKPQLIHLNELFKGERKIQEAQVINLCGGFLHGDILGSGMCAAD